MSIATDLNDNYQALKSMISMMLNKAQVLLDVTENESDEDNQLLVSVKDDMLTLSVMVMEMSDKIQFRLDN